MEPVVYTTRYETKKEADTFNQNYNDYTSAKKRSEELAAILLREKTKLASFEALYEQTNVKEKQILEKMTLAQKKIEKGQNLAVKAQELAEKSEALAEKSEALAEKAASLQKESDELVARAQAGIEQKCKTMHLQLDKIITVSKTKITYVSKFVESDETKGVLHELRQFILNAENLKQEAQPTRNSLATALPQFREIGKNFNELIAKIGKMQ